MRGKTCLVTGANAGIGKETVVGLAARGARVLMVCRHRGRGEEAVEEVESRVPGAVPDLLLADLSSLRQVRGLVEDVKGRADRLDVLVSNAGVFGARRRMTEDGFERTFAVNHLAPFVLVRGLLELLRRSAPARVVVVASAAHFHGTIAFDDLHAEKRRYGGWRAYSQSKLANVLFAAELARRVRADEVSANSLHPGVVATKLLLRGLVPRWLARPWTITPEEGARTPLYLATSPDVEGVSGRYFEDCEPREPSAEAQDAGVASRLWTASRRLEERAMDECKPGETGVI
ncbi:MAG: SDR family oxidoreductase [Gemmatimonadota bacterium]